MLHIWGKIRVTEGSDSLPSSTECKLGSRHRGWGEGHTHLEAEVLGSSLSPTTYLPFIITGNLSTSKYIICKMGTSTMVPSMTAAWARDDRQPASSLKSPKPLKEVCTKARE